MPFPKPTLKGLFGKKEKRSGMKDQSKKDDKGDHLGTEMKGSGESLPGSLETSEDAESPVTGYGDGNLPSLHASQAQSPASQGGASLNPNPPRQARALKHYVGTKVSPSLTQPVRPPRGTDTKLPYTVLGQVNAGQLHHASMSSGYETDDNPSSVASDMPSSCDGAGDSQERPAEGISPEIIAARLTVSNMSLCFRKAIEGEGVQRFQSADSGGSGLCSPATSTVVMSHPVAGGGREDGPPRASTCKPAAASSRTPSFSSFPAHSSGMSCVSFATEDGELFPESALNTPIGALRKSRARLCLYLNIPQDPVESDLPPDYTGLAELLDFEAVEIQNFWERNPSDDLFREWVRCEEKQPFLWNLVYLLKKLGRQDILEECQGLILEDVADYIAEQAMLKIYAVNRLHNFDCYVNIADQDLTTYGREILDTLEGVYRLRLCLTLRDVNVGGWQFDEMAKMLEERCQGKVLIVMSKYYEDSDACQFLTQFAVTLDPGARMNKLIPLLVDEGVFIPRVLRCLAILNYHRDKRLGFLWPRLKTAIKND